MESRGLWTGSWETWGYFLSSCNGNSFFQVAGTRGFQHTNNWSSWGSIASAKAALARATLAVWTERSCHSSSGELNPQLTSAQGLVLERMNASIYGR